MRQAWFNEMAEKNPGLVLQVGKMSQKKNEGLYACAKLLLNTLWGKANQRSNMVQRIYVGPHDYQKYFKYFTDPSLQCKWIDLAPQLAEIQYVKKDADIEITQNTCITVGVWTTAQGRLVLYRQLKKMADDQPLYCDTDSIMYYYDPLDDSHHKVTCIADQLGSWTDELKKENARGEVCVEFVAGGPKNYGYMTECIAGKAENLGKRYSSFKVKGHKLKGGHADFQSAQNALTYTKFKEVILRNAYQVLGHADYDVFLKEALSFAPVKSYFEENPKDNVDEYGNKVEELKVVVDKAGKAAITLLYHDRFKVGRALKPPQGVKRPPKDPKKKPAGEMFNVVVDKDYIKYGWSFDKAVLLESACAHNLSTRPFGHAQVAKQQSNRAAAAEEDEEKVQ